MAWGPAPVVSEESLKLWEKYFGKNFYAFEHGGCRFIIVDAQIINTRLAAEDLQRAWLEGELARDRDGRTFLFLHYPPYLHDRDEDEHYDNIAEPGRAWLLDLIARSGPEALFAGHVHNFWYNRFAGTDCYVVPSVGFVRSDFAELFRVEPAAEFGRNDAAKLGFFLIDVYERGHAFRLVRTGGRTADPDAPAAAVLVPAARAAPRARPTVGVELRQSWADATEITASGHPDEFGRKRARNDYALLALQEMGIAKLRVPLQNLDDPETRARMREFMALGHAFTVRAFGAPDAGLAAFLGAHRDLVRGIELVNTQAAFATAAGAIRRFKDAASVRVHLSPLRTKRGDAAAARGAFIINHGVHHGFTARDAETAGELVKASGLASAVDGLVFRIVREASVWDEIATVTVRLAATESPAEAVRNDLEHANRVSEAVVAAAAFPEIDVFIDTLADIDRGYFVRNGLVDRLYNPRLAAVVVRHLNEALARIEGDLALGPKLAMAGCRVCAFRSPDAHRALILPDRALTLAEIALPGVGAGATGEGTVTRLDSGVVARIRWRRHGTGSEAGFRFARPLQCDAPALLTIPASANAPAPHR
ncbi:MAG: hypothetical protein QF902_10315 [Rhodospirillales bacterium]|jgi:hypothetical protein|nr:hypothetical protein [Rhodospirillales bacterium]